MNSRHINRWMRISSVFAILSLNALAQSAGGNPFPNDSDIDRLYSPTNRPSVLMSALYPVLTNLHFEAVHYPSQDIARLRWHLMTNMLACTVTTDGDIPSEFAVKTRLVGWAFSFPQVRSDADALLMCADYIGELGPVSTNDYWAELLVANAADRELRSANAARKPGLLVRGRDFGPNRRRFEEKWNPILRYNAEMSRHRKAVLLAFRETVRAFASERGASALMDIRPKIVDRAHLSDDETAFVFLELNLLFNIYKDVGKVYGSSTYFDAETLFMGVRGGDGLVGNADTEKPFLELVAAVSNNHAAIERSWDGYGTNEVVRFTVLSAVGFSGVDVYTNFTAAIVARCERTGDTNDWESVRFLLTPVMTDQERAFMMNYDKPPYDDLLRLIRDCATRRNDTKTVEVCDEYLSGEPRREYLDLKEAGGIE